MATRKAGLHRHLPPLQWRETPLAAKTRSLTIWVVVGPNSAAGGEICRIPHDDENCHQSPFAAKKSPNCDLDLGLEMDFCEGKVWVLS